MQMRRPSGRLIEVHVVWGRSVGDERTEPVGDFGIALAGGMLVEKGCSGGGVAHSGRITQTV